MKLMLFMLFALQFSSIALAEQENVVEMKVCDIITLENRELVDIETGETFLYQKKVYCNNPGVLVQCQRQQYPASESNVDHNISKSIFLSANQAQGTSQGMIHNGVQYFCGR